MEGPAVVAAAAQRPVESPEEWTCFEVVILATRGQELFQCKECPDNGRSGIEFDQEHERRWQVVARHVVKRKWPQ
jgi:hypothetical protein